MENKNIDIELRPLEMLDAFDTRTESCTPYHMRNESIASQVLDVMFEKTKMYGGSRKLDTLHEQATKSYYEGVGRKSDRIQGILRRLRDGDEEARLQLIDTLIDICGYSILMLNDILTHGEKK